jgi:glycosyltransferase involved in cell wall biosynthesis
MAPTPAEDEAPQPAAPTAPWLSVVMPVHDEIGALPALLGELGKALAPLDFEAELIFVDDGSRDGSLEWLRAEARLDPRVRVLALGERKGQSSALDAGFRVARGDVVATLDADGQNDPADLPRLLSLLAARDDVDVVCGVRVERHDTAPRRWASRVANAVRNRLTHDHATDVGCSIRVMRAPFVRALHLERGLHRFLPTLLRLEGARIIEAPVAHRPRSSGRSKYGVLDRLPEAARDLWTVRRRIARPRSGTRPGS